MSQNHKSSKNRPRGFELLEGRCLLSISTADPQYLAIAAPLDDGQAARTTNTSPEAAPHAVLQTSPATGTPDMRVAKPVGHLPDSLFVPGTMGEFDVLIRVQATDAAGNPLTQIDAGVEFYLRVYVQDTSRFGHGVFGSYLDIHYDLNLARATGPIEFAFPNGKHGTLTPGVIGGAGAFDDLVRDDRRVELLFSVPMQAKNDGELTFVVQPPQRQSCDTLLYDLDTPVSPSRIHFQNSSLSVLPAPQGEKPDLPEYTKLDPYPDRYAPKANTPPRTTGRTSLRLITSRSRWNRSM